MKYSFTVCDCELRDPYMYVCVRFVGYYREFRSLVIEMVLATDMTSHFQQVKTMKTALGHHDFSLDKPKSLCLILHACDISHPSKDWELHTS